MIELLIAAAATSAYPAVWANDYCFYRGTGKAHEEAVELATQWTGEPTEEAWSYVEANTTWCPTE